MSFARTFELGCAVVVASLEIALVTLGMREAYHVSSYLNKPSEVSQTAVAAFLLYLLPSIPVLLGSYFHAVKRESGGIVLLAFGCFLVLCAFVMSLYGLAGKGYNNAVGRMNLALFAMAITTIIVSAIVEKQNRETVSSS